MSNLISPIKVGFIDLDGVLADFNQGVKDLTSCTPDPTYKEISKKDMWKAIGKSKTFFEDLKLLPDALELWDYVNSLNLTVNILTGLPSINDGGNQKRRWCAKHLVPPPNHIEVCFSRHKPNFATPDSLLIDDRKELVDGFIQAGGHGILHTSTKSTIGQLKKLGLVPA